MAVVVGSRGKKHGIHGETAEHVEEKESLCKRIGLYLQ